MSYPIRFESRTNLQCMRAHECCGGLKFLKSLQEEERLFASKIAAARERAAEAAIAAAGAMKRVTELQQMRQECGSGCFPELVQVWQKGSRFDAWGPRGPRGDQTSSRLCSG